MDVKRNAEKTEVENLGLSINTSAVAAANETLDDYFELFGSQIQMVQLSDSDDEDEQMVLGEGLQDISGHLKSMKSIIMKELFR